MPAISAIHKVTGYYPPKNLASRIIDLLGEDPDLDRMQLTFDSWTAEGNKPINLAGWLFDWYATNMHYVHPSRKILAPGTSCTEPKY